MLLDISVCYDLHGSYQYYDVVVVVHLHFHWDNYILVLSLFLLK